MVPYCTCVTYAQLWGDKCPTDKSSLLEICQHVSKNIYYKPATYLSGQSRQCHVLMKQIAVENNWMCNCLNQWLYSGLTGRSVCITLVIIILWELCIFSALLHEYTVPNVFGVMAVSSILFVERQNLSKDKKAETPLDFINKIQKTKQFSAWQ